MAQSGHPAPWQPCPPGTLVAALEDDIEGVDDAGYDEGEAEHKVDEELDTEAVHEEDAGGGEEEAEDEGDEPPGVAGRAPALPRPLALALS